MKKPLIFILIAFPFTYLPAQRKIEGSLFGTPYSFSAPTMHSSGGGGGNNSTTKWNSGSSSSSPSPTSGEVLDNAYKTKANEEYAKGVAAWKKRDWGAAIRFFNSAIAYNPNQKTYAQAKVEAQGYKEWDKGVEEANSEHWDKAIDYYKKSLEYLPDNPTLKNNIIGCSYNKTLGLAEKYFTAGDWVKAAVYYNVLLKNFGNTNEFVQSRFSESYSKISNMKNSERGFSKYDSKLDEVKKDLPFINNGW